MNDVSSILIALLFCFVVVPIGLYVFGYQMGKRAGERTLPTPPASPPATSTPPTLPVVRPDTEITRVRWLLEELAREPMLSTLTESQRAELAREYRVLLNAMIRQEPEAAPIRPVISAPQPAQDRALPTELADTVEPSRTPTTAPAPSSPDFAAAPAQELETPAQVFGQRTDDEPVSHGRELDPAVMLLYVGALMIVAAGVIYAAYNWADFTAWQKLGALAATTLAFIAAGLGFRRSERLEPAADTFLSIGALLVPTIAVAAWQVLEGAQARPELPLFFGALATAIVHGAFAIRPGGRLYDYGAVISAAIAAATLPAAIGADERWGAPLAMALLAGFPILAGPLARLNRPRLLVSLLAVPLIAIAAVSGAFEQDSTRWILPVTLAAATFALLRVPLFAPGARRLAEMAATVTAILVIPTGFHALDEVRTLTGWGTIAMATAIGWTAATLGIPRLRERHISAAMTVELIATFLLAYAMFSDDGSNTLALVTGVAGLAAVTLIAWTRDWHLLLPVSAWFLLCGLGSIAFMSDLDDASDIGKLRFAALYPVSVMLGAIAVRRWWHAGTRSRAARPLWLVTIGAVAFVVVAGTGMALDDASLTAQVLIVLVSQALVTLLAASHLRSPGVLIGYGAILCVGIVLGVARWVPEDMALPVTAGIATVGAFFALWPTRQSTVSLPAPLRLFATPHPRLEVVPLSGMALVALAGVIAVSLRSIVATYTRPEGNDLELATSGWIAHVAVMALLVGASVWIGLLADDEAPGSPDRSLFDRLHLIVTWVPLALGALVIASVTSMLTRELLVATWPWMIIATGIAAAGMLWRPETRYLQALRGTMEIGGPVLLGATTLLNLSASTGTVPDNHLLGQVVMFAGLSLAAAALGARATSGYGIYAAATLLVLSCWFGTRYTDAGDTGTMLSFIALAWVFAGTGVVANGRPRFTWSAGPLLVSAVTTSSASILFAAPQTSTLLERDADHLRGLVVIWLMSLAGLLSLAAWLYTRRDFAFWASGMAMLALLLQISSRSPGTIHAFSVPVAAWLFTLGIVERNHSPRANALFGAGAGVLVVPTMLEALASNELRWLLIILAEGIVLFLVGLALRLRVPIAAGVLIISVLVLRMAVDAVNALPNWVALLSVGLALLIGGTIWISFRDDVQRWRSAFTERWGRLR